MRAGAALWLAIVQVRSQVRQRQNVLTVMTFASVSTALPRQNGHAAGRVTGPLTPDSDTSLSRCAMRTTARHIPMMRAQLRRPRSTAAFPGIRVEAGPCDGLYSIAHGGPVSDGCTVFSPSAVHSGTALAASNRYPRTMPSQHAMPATYAGPVVIDTATGAVMTPAIAVTPDNDSEMNQRWSAWRARGARDDRHRAQTMQRLCVALIVILSGWFVVQLLS
jgi:hypothetical protein